MSGNGMPIGVGPGRVRRSPSAVAQFLAQWLDA